MQSHLGFTIQPKKDLIYDSELPGYFEEVLNKWRRYSQSSTF